MNDQTPYRAVLLDWPMANVARITIHNETHRNALTKAMWEQLIAIADGLAADPNARVVILRGAGGLAFSSGADISEFQSLRHDDAGYADYNPAIIGGMKAVERLPMPVIAQIDGVCVGGGMALAAMCDLRFMDETGRIGIPAGKLGIAYLPDWVKRITDITGSAAAMQIFLTAGIYDVQKALTWGFTHAVLPKGEVEAHALAVAERIAGLAPLSLRAGKLAVRQSREIGENRDWEAAWTACYACDASEDYREGVAAYVAGRTPVFHGK